jgi:hypothetical protein
MKAICLTNEAGYLALFVEDKVTEEDVHKLHIVDTLAMYHVSKKKVDVEYDEDDEDEDEE